MNTHIFIVTKLKNRKRFV